MKPLPKREIVVEVATSDKRLLWITVYTNDAARFVSENAGRFGNLHPPINGRLKYELFIDAGYDPDEVAAWIERMGGA